MQIFFWTITYAVLWWLFIQDYTFLCKLCVKCRYCHLLFLELYLSLNNNFPAIKIFYEPLLLPFDTPVRPINQMTDNYRHSFFYNLIRFHHLPANHLFGMKNKTKI